MDNNKLLAEIRYIRFQAQSVIRSCEEVEKYLNPPPPSKEKKTYVSEMQMEKILEKRRRYLARN